MTREEARLAVAAAEDAMLVHGRNEQTQAALDAAVGAYYEVMMEDSLQATLSRMLGEALEREGVQFPAGQSPAERFAAITKAAGFGPVPERVEVTFEQLREQQRAEILDAYEIPESLRAAWRQIDEEA